MEALQIRVLAFWQSGGEFVTLRFAILAEWTEFCYIRICHSGRVEGNLLHEDLP